MTKPAMVRDDATKRWRNRENYRDDPRGFSILEYLSWSIFTEVMHHDPELVHRIEYADYYMTKHNIWELGSYD